MCERGFTATFIKTINIYDTSEIVYVETEDSESDGDKKPAAKRSKAG